MRRTSKERVSTWECVAPGIYRDNRKTNGVLFERPTINGVRTFRSLETTKIEAKPFSKPGARIKCGQSWG
jgi:hypothetical protein